MSREELVALVAAQAEEIMMLRGGKFELFFLLADPSAAQVFSDYDASDPAARGYPGLDSLPAGVWQVGTVTVIRA